MTDTNDFMTDIATKLADLSAKATQGVWSSMIEPQSYPECDDHDYPATVNGPGKHIAFFHETDRNEVDAALCATLVNAFRAGDLVLATEITALREQVTALRRNVAGWVQWHEQATDDDDCEYLNSCGWIEAEALASTGIGLIAALSAEGQG